MKIIIYILCYNAESRAVAEAQYGSEPWARILFIHSTPYLENVMFNHYFTQLEHEWRDADYVGTLSWKARTKIDFNMSAIIAELAEVQPDVFALYPGKPGSLFKQARKHPKFKQLWLAVMQRLRVTKAAATSDAITPFYCNYWVAKPGTLRRYMQFYQRVVQILNEDSDLQQDLWADAKYTGMPPERLVQIFGCPYYPHHPFVCERLPCFFFWYTGCFVHTASPHVRRVLTS